MLIRILILAIFCSFLFATNLVAQHHSNSNQKQKTMMGCCSNHKNHNNEFDEDESSNSIQIKNSDMQHKHSEKKSGSIKKNPILREGIIELSEIDQNKDGNVYQCQMCWNVISDKSENCPICEMKLKKVSIENAKENLQKNGFKVKE